MIDRDRELCTKATRSGGLAYRVWCEKAAEARSVLVESPK